MSREEEGGECQVRAIDNVGTESGRGHSKTLRDQEHCGELPLGFGVPSAAFVADVVRPRCEKEDSAL